MSPLQAHLHMLENWPKERITKHEQTPPRTPASIAYAAYRSTLARLSRAGIARPISSELLKRYVELKKSGVLHLEVKRELQVSTRTLAKLRDIAKKDGLL